MPKKLKLLVLLSNLLIRYEIPFETRMKFDKISGLDNEQFRRLTEVKRTTFEKMVLILREAYKAARWIEDT